MSLGLLFYTRLAGLGQSFWHDEVWSVLKFIDPGPAVIFSEYIPNNHMLFSLLAWGTTRFLPGGEVTYRLWGVVPSLLAVVLLVHWLWRREGPTVAALFSLLVLTSPLHLDYAREARGYGLAFLASAGILWAGDSILASRGRQSVAAFGLAGLLGILTLPVFVLPFVLSFAVRIADMKPFFWPQADLTAPYRAESIDVRQRMN
ncbi:MAG: hypothetical protein P8R42_11645 [Candidatus Binatia bacterium]|nr:hypothetical protein [Candidatus Binatia bacterium]